jgi:hypothetical protein
MKRSREAGGPHPARYYVADFPKPSISGLSRKYRYISGVNEDSAAPRGMSVSLMSRCSLIGETPMPQCRGTSVSRH